MECVLLNVYGGYHPYIFSIPHTHTKQIHSTSPLLIVDTEKYSNLHTNVVLLHTLQLSSNSARKSLVCYYPVN